MDSANSFFKTFDEQITTVMSHLQISTIVPSLKDFQDSYNVMDYAGLTYLGHVENNKPNGLGFLFSSSHIAYGGMFAKGQKSGFGVAFRHNHPLYEGEFCQGNYHGYGTIYYTIKKQIEYQGEFVKGKFHGTGRYYDVFFGRLIFRGEFRNNNYHKGVMYSYNSPYRGKIFSGLYKNNKILKGKMYNAEGKVVYKGFFNNKSQAHGAGKEYATDGVTYKGTFFNGKCHGSFKVTHKGGRVERLVFTHGQQRYDV